MPYLSVMAEADRLSKLEVGQARSLLDRRLSAAQKLTGIAQEEALAFNARLVTALRERGVRVWG